MSTLNAIYCKKCNEKLYVGQRPGSLWNDIFEILGVFLWEHEGHYLLYVDEGYLTGNESEAVKLFQPTEDYMPKIVYVQKKDSNKTIPCKVCGEETEDIVYLDKFSKKYASCHGKCINNKILKEIWH